MSSCQVSSGVSSDGHCSAHVIWYSKHGEKREKHELKLQVLGLKGKRINIFQQIK